MPTKGHISLLFCFSAPFFERGSVSGGFAKIQSAKPKGYTRELKRPKPARKHKAGGLHARINAPETYAQAQSQKAIREEESILNPRASAKHKNSEGLHSSLPLRVAPIKRTPRLPKRAQCSSLVPTKRKISLERYRGGFISTTFIATSEFWGSYPLTNFMRCKAKVFTQSREVKFTPKAK